jgi:4-hydroxy-tetrahydrodipicolinate synthase
MHDDMSLDIDGLQRLVDHLIGQGIHGLTPCAVTGEAESLSLDEQKQVLRATVEAAAHRVPVYSGIGRSSLLETLALVPYAEEIGSDGLFVITPFCNGYSVAEVDAYYRELARRTALPIMIYNCPGYSKINISPSMSASLAGVPNIVATKEGNQDQLHETVLATGNRLAVFTARDSYLLPSMAVGATGVVSFAANVAPALLVRLYDAVRSGDLPLARDLHCRVTVLVRALVARSYPTMIKEAMRLAGLPSGALRRTGVPVTSEERAVLQDALRVAEVG